MVPNRLFSLACRPFGLTASIVFGAVILMSGCGKSTSKTAQRSSESAGRTIELSNLKGKIEIDGSSTVQPISNAMVELFRVQYPDVVVNVSGAGTGNGFERFALKETDISGASRPIKSGEMEKCKEAGVEFVELPVAYDGLTFVINPKNDWAETLTVEQLKRIFASDDPAMKWSDIDPSWPKDDINIFAPGTGSGTYDYTREVLAKDSSLRSDMDLNEDDNFLVKGVAGNKYSISFFGVAYFEENRDKLKAVQIVNPKDGKAYLPTTENISSNLYSPFSRPLFLYVNVNSTDKAEVQTFVEYYLDNASKACEKVGYTPLPEEIVDRGRQNYFDLVAGTHFVTDDGEKRDGALADVFNSDNLVK